MSDVLSEATGCHGFGPPCVSGHSAVANADISHEAGAYEVIPSQLRVPPKSTHSDQTDIRGAAPCQSPAYWDLFPAALGSADKITTKCSP